MFISLLVQYCFWPQHAAVFIEKVSTKHQTVSDELVNIMEHSSHRAKYFPQELRPKKLRESEYWTLKFARLTET